MSTSAIKLVCLPLRQLVLFNKSQPCGNTTVTKLIKRHKSKTTLKKATTIKSESAELPGSTKKLKVTKKVANTKGHSINSKLCKDKEKSDQCSGNFSESAGEREIINKPNDSEDVHVLDHKIQHQSARSFQTPSQQSKPVSCNVNDKNTKISKHIDTLNALDDVIDDLANSLLYISKYPLLGNLTKVSPGVEESFRGFVTKHSTPLLPSVTRIIQDTMSDMSRYYLERWKNQMIEQLGLEGFQEYQKETFAIGQNFHGSISEILEGKSLQDVQVMPKNEGHLESLEAVLPKIQEVYAVEKMVKHEQLHYQGKFDCVALFRDNVCVIDWKTSSKPKPTLYDTYDNPLQLAAYLGALNSSRFLKDKGVEEVTTAAVIVAYANGDPAHVHFMNRKTCEEYWKQWLQRLHQYWEHKAPKRMRNKS